MHRGIATFTLDEGRCPRWLFERMVKLGRQMTEILIIDYGPDEFVKRLADPVWFQSLGTVLAFDWNASGLTTILTAALKEALRGQEKELGVFICGGKGKTSRRTPEEIHHWGERLSLPPSAVQKLDYNSRLAAKVDSALVQDGYQIYHHSFIFSQNGAWTVVQQGMNTASQTARRYHWHSEKLADFVCEPHTAIASQLRHQSTLNLTAQQSEATRSTSVGLIDGGYPALMKDIEILRRHATRLSQVIQAKAGQQTLTFLNLENKEFKYHPVVAENFSQSRYLEKILARLTYEQPGNYEKVLATDGVGPKTIRALALVAEVIYGAQPSYQDPARYSFAHGGKDATPYPIDRQTYDQTIAILSSAIEKTKINPSEKSKILKKLNPTELRH